MHTCESIYAIAVGSDIDAAVASLAEAGYLVDKSGVGIVELIYIAIARELALFARTEIDDSHTTYTTHPQAIIGVDERPDTSSDKIAALEWHQEFATARVVEEDTVVAAYPQSVVELVIGKGSDMGDDSGILRLHLKTIETVGVIHIKPIHTSAPCAYPQYAVGGSECAHRVMSEWRIGCCEMCECLLACPTAVETTVNSAHPQCAVGLHKCGINTAI